MSTGQSVANWFETSSDWLNAILVKETRQALKSRQFVVTFMLLLIVSWLIAVFGMLVGGDAVEFGSTGGVFFAFYLAVLSTAIFVIVPFGAFRSLLNERDQFTFDMLSITTLSPRQIVIGKLLSAFVQLLIYYSAVAPFIAFASLLPGFDLPSAAFLLVSAMTVSFSYSMFMLMLSTFAKQRHWQTLLTVMVLLALVWQQFFWYAMTFSAGLASSMIPFDEPGFWWAVACYVLGVGSYLVLFLQITTAQLTFESDNRSSGIRLTAAAQFWLFWIVSVSLVAYFARTSGMPFPEEMIPACGIIAAIHWSVFGLFAATEPDYLSRRVRRRLPKNSLLKVLYTPFLPGGGRGFLYLVLHLFALWWIAVTLMPFADSYKSFQAEPVSYLINVMTFDPVAWTSELRVVTGLCCYVTIYIGIGAAMGRWLRTISMAIFSGHVRVLTVLVMAAACIAPYIFIWLAGDHDISYRLAFISNPFHTLDDVWSSGGHSQAVTLLLLLGAFVSLLVNAPAMVAGVRDIVESCGKRTVELE
jgi:hypothetical protein